MSLILHLVRWDVRRFRVLLSLWLLLVAAGALLEGAWPSAAVAMEARQTVSLTGNLLALVEMLFSMVSIALVVQEHPLVGTSAFWVTRPIPPRALLVSKLILLSAVVIAAPVMAEVVLMTVYKVPVSEMAAVAAQSTLFRALWLSAIVAFAAPTPNLSKFAGAIGGVLVTVWALLITANAVTNDWTAGAATPVYPETGSYDPTPLTVGGILFVCAVVVFLLVLYRTRSRGRSLAIGAAGIAVVWAVGSTWPWPVLAPRTETPAWAMDPSVLQLSARPDPMKVRAPQYGYEAPVWTVAEARIQLDGLAPGWSSEAAVREASIRANGRELIASRVQGPRSRPAIDESRDQTNAVIRRLLNVRRLVEWNQEADSAVVMVARTGDLRGLPAETLTYDGRFRLSLTRHQVEAVLPLGVGAAVRRGAYQLRLNRIRLREDRISLLVAESDASSMFSRQLHSRVDYYLRSPDRLDAVYAARRPLGEMALGRFFLIVSGDSESRHSGFRAMPLSLEFPSSYGGAEPSVAFDDTWLSRAELVIVRSTEVGAVERRLAIADFPIRNE